jgi:hypothetical protein
MASLRPSPRSFLHNSIGEPVAGQKRIFAIYLPIFAKAAARQWYLPLAEQADVEVRRIVDKIEQVHPWRSCAFPGLVSMTMQMPVVQ